MARQVRNLRGISGLLRVQRESRYDKSSDSYNLQTPFVGFPRSTAMVITLNKETARATQRGGPTAGR